MQRLILSTLSVLTISAMATPALNAQVIGAASFNPPPSTYISSADITAFNLVFLAYQGSLSNAGIPSAGQFLDDARMGKITAKSLVQAAVNSNRLPAAILDDRGYLGSVDNQLMTLYNQR